MEVFVKQYNKNYNFRYLKAKMHVRYWVDCEFSEDNGQSWNKDFDDTKEECLKVREHIPFVSIVKNNIDKKEFGWWLKDEEEDYWTIIIDLENGKILDWPKGFCLNTFYKVCDEGDYSFLDENKNEVLNITDKFEQYYVPNFMSLEDEGFGDYVYLNIDGEGNIEHFELMNERIKDYFLKNYIEEDE